MTSSPSTRRTHSKFGNSHFSTMMLSLSSSVANNSQTEDDNVQERSRSQNDDDTGPTPPSPAAATPATPVMTEINPRWKGYVFIALCSLINFASIANIPRRERRDFFTSAGIVFGVVTFCLSVVILVLLQDRSSNHSQTRKPRKLYQYSKAWDGYLEGGTLGFMVLWWICGVAYMTHADGIAYIATNIYFSSWGCLCSCLYSLERWSASKDILSIRELTSLSATLPSWWVLFLSGLIVGGTCIDLTVRLQKSQTRDDEDPGDAVFGVALGAVTTVLAFWYLLVHYDFVGKGNAVLEEGGWLELSVSCFLMIVWTIGLSILTQDEGVAATIAGSGCAEEDPILAATDYANCTILVYVVYEEDADNAVLTELPCPQLPRQVPGSNLYFAGWTCFFASLNIALRWKAARASQLAQSQERQRWNQQHHQLGETRANEDEQDDGDDD